MPITADQHNERRRATKQNASAKARAAHKKSDTRGEKFSFVFDANLSEKTLAKMVDVCIERNYKHFNRAGLIAMARSGDLSVKIFENEPAIGGQEVLITMDGFKAADGGSLPMRIYKIVVPMIPPLAMTFSYDRDTGRLLIK